MVTAKTMLAAVQPQLHDHGRSKVQQWRSQLLQLQKHRRMTAALRAWQAQERRAVLLQVRRFCCPTRTTVKQKGWAAHQLVLALALPQLMGQMHAAQRRDSMLVTLP